jgi:hypothetical protein
MASPGLAALLNAKETSRFLAEVWPHQLLKVDGPLGRLAGLVDADFDALVEMKALDTSAFRCADGRTVSVRATREQLRPLYTAGFTIYFDHLRSPSIDAWVKALEDELGLVKGGTVITAFASRHGEGLTPHFDGNDNFICQARGAKRWRIAENRHIRYPTSGHLIGRKPRGEQVTEAPRGFPETMPEATTVIDMTPGSVMFMPRGMWHTVETVEGESLHFNIRVGLPTWRDLIEYMLRHTGGEFFEGLRAPIPRLYDGDQLAPGVADELRRHIIALGDRLAAGAETGLPKDRVHEFLVRLRKLS